MTLTDLPALGQSLLMLDFDGTLVALADTPQGIKVPETLCTLLNALDDRSAGLTIVTGRALGDLEQLLPEYQGDIFGSHGGEQRVNHVYDQTSAVTPSQVEKIWDGADKIAKTADGLIAERKPAGAVVHYRQARTQEDMVQNATAELTRRSAEFEVHSSKMASEIRPVGVSKADAAKAVIAAAPSGSIPIFAGDDKTDEEAMAVVNAKNGITIKVGEGASCAGVRVATPLDMRQTLQEWLEATSP